MSDSDTTGEKNVLSGEAEIEHDILPPSKNKYVDASAFEDNIRKIRGWRWVLVCAGLYISCLMYGLDTTIAADVQGAVTKTFQDVPQLPWIGAGFPLGSVAVILPYNALFGKFNMKWLYIGGVVLFQAGSALCGAAPTIDALIVGRVLTGAGGTGIYLGGLNHLSALCTREERGTYISGLSFCWGVGTILGPVVGGGFSLTSATWRWGFYINLIIGAVGAPVLFLIPVIRPSKGTSVVSRLLHVDWVGAVLSCGIWVAFALAFVSAGGIWAWNDGKTIATIVVFAILLVIYAVQQYFCIFTTPVDRSFPGHLLKSRIQILTYITTSCTITAMYVTTFYIPVYFQFVNDDSPLMAAVRLLPLLLVSIAFTLGSGWLLPKINVYATFYLFSGILLTLTGSLFYALLKPSTPVAGIYVILVIMGIGVGSTMQMGYAVASLKVHTPIDAGNALTLQNVSQIGSQVLCLVIAGRVFQSIATSNLTKVLVGQGFTQADIQNAVAGTQSLLFEKLSGNLKTEALVAVTSAIQRTYILVIVAGALEIVCSLLMKWEKLFPGETAPAEVTEETKETTSV